MKRTEWYPSNTNPVREGWYEVQCTFCRKHYWTGKKWKISPIASASLWPTPWRGLTEEAK